MKKRSIIQPSLLIVAAATLFVIGEGSSSSIGASEEQVASSQQHQQHTHAHSSIKPNLRRKNNNKHDHHRTLVTDSYCGRNWQEAHDNCDPNTCSNDEDCGPGLYCHHYIECTPSSSNTNNDDNGPTNGGLPPSDIVGYSNVAEMSMPLIESEPVPVPTPLTDVQQQQNTPSPNYMPAYIASLPIREPGSTPPPFTLPQPTPNTMSNPTNNYCGYGWESAVAECFHACPSGKDEECPGGRTCHSWLNCQQATVDPAIYNVCGNNWDHAASTCSTRCFLGGDDTCPSGQSCFGGVTDCENNPNLPPLTAEDVGLVEKSYTQEEIALLLDEEIAKGRDEEQMSNPNNWWCGSSWSNMLETCSKRCQTDEECKVNSWTEGYCFKTTGGPENCSTPGVPVKEAQPAGSMWCGSSWNNMLETCDKQCTSDEDCGSGKTCWSAPNTCQYIGVPVKETSEVGSLWCGVDYDDAMTSCHKSCPGETNEECPDGMSCFSGSSCSVEGEPVIRVGYKCGTSWEHASETCGNECQNNDDCNVNNGEECFADVVCASEIEAQQTSGSFCGSSVSLEKMYTSTYLGPFQDSLVFSTHHDFAPFLCFLFYSGEKLLTIAVNHAKWTMNVQIRNGASGSIVTWIHLPMQIWG